MSIAPSQILSHYQSKIQTTQANTEAIKKRIDYFSYVRIGLFFTEILFFVLLLNTADDGWRILVQIGLIIPVIFFVFIVRKQSTLDRAIAYEKELLWVYQNEWNVLNGQPNGYDHGVAFESDAHPYSADLDIFGHTSLFAMVNRCSTITGNKLLAQKFANRTTRQEILSRQEAIKEVQAKIADTFDFRAHLHGHNAEKIEQIKSQLKTKLGNQLAFVRGKFLKNYVFIAPFLSLSLALAGIFWGAVFWKLLVLLLIIHIGLNVRLNPKINLVFYSFGGSSSLLNSYAIAIRWTESQNWKSKYILSLFHSKIPVSQEIKNLSKVIQNFDARLNILVGGILNGLLLWDLKCCISLDKWHKTSSDDVISGLDHLSDFEELISFATMAYNHPQWSIPEISEDFSLKAQEIGHPLIAENIRVNNTYEVENHSTVDIVTGSNMAGKSTFLRTLGINMVLAYAGASVCAGKMKLSVFSIITYMRIKDSLNESTSTFKAELNRLKMILDCVVNDQDTFVLIDEMLRGTNSRDKYLGSKVFVEKLIAEKTPALFATHDLQLADLKNAYPKTLRNFHFDISIIGGEMKFDYKLKQGPCATFNAAILLKEIGLSLD